MDVAHWMLAEFKRNGILFHDIAVDRIREIFSFEFTHPVDDGYYGIDLRMFSKNSARLQRIQSYGCRLENTGRIVRMVIALNALRRASLHLPIILRLPGSRA